MNSRLKIPLIVLAAIIVGSASIAYGAMTAPRPEDKQLSSAPLTLSKTQLSQQLAMDQSTITQVLVKAYPAIATDYTVVNGQLFEQGQWYGAVLTYHGSDTTNRDSLRVLLQKTDDIWTLRTKPPVPLLSTKQFPDVPKSVLKTINQEVALP